MLNINEAFWQQAIFYILAMIALGSASMVIVSKHPVRAALCLILTFFVTAALWLILEAEFLAMILILVYIGAVMVLFLFVVMMLDVDYAALKAKFTRYLPLGICIPVLLLVLLVNVVGPHDFGKNSVLSPIAHPSGFSDVRMLGKLLFSKYIFHFEIAGLLLLAAIVAAIRLTFRGPQKRKSQSIEEQVQVKARDRVRLVQMPFSENQEEN